MNDNIMNKAGLLAFEKSVQEQVMRWCYVCWFHFGKATLQNTIWIGPGS
jgi:hypothetical protein